jgi:hypothetical protein
VDLSVDHGHVRNGCTRQPLIGARQTNFLDISGLPLGYLTPKVGQYDFGQFPAGVTTRRGIVPACFNNGVPEQHLQTEGSLT